jgi:hypothetical protein
MDAEPRGEMERDVLRQSLKPISASTAKTVELKLNISPICRI